jgi:signal transduction histidine kinase
LAIVARAVDAHGGKIAVDTVLDEGTTFTIHIPTSTR